MARHGRSLDDDGCGAIVATGRSSGSGWPYGGHARPAAPITPAAMAAAAVDTATTRQGYLRTRRARPSELIFNKLQQTHWNRKETAEILGISYKALLYKIKENGLDKAS
jgi:DNA-binding NtrC family response regulator